MAHAGEDVGASTRGLIGGICACRGSMALDTIPPVQVPLDALPDDVEMLHRLVRDMADVVESKSSALDESRTEIARLWQIIRELQRTRFGRSAEHLDPGQLALALEAAEADLANAETAQPAPVPPPASCALPPRPHRTVLPAHLPRLESAVPVPHQCCPDCGGALRDAGESVAEMLDWVPAQVRVLRIRRPKCACRACGTLHQAPAPERILAKGLATPALVAHVLVSRYCDHLPLHRQSRILARHGAPIARSTLCDWVGQACWWLEPLHARLMTHVLAGERVFADDTPLPVLQPGKGRTQTGRLWAYARDDRPWGGETPPAVAFRYEPDRKAVRPVEHLRGYRGILQVDGYGGFEALGEGGPDDAGRLLGALAAALLRSALGGITDRERGAGADRRTVRGRGQDSRSATAGAPGGTAGREPQHGRGTAVVAGGETGPTPEPQSFGGGDPLRAGPVDGADAVSRRRAG